VSDQTDRNASEDWPYSIVRKKNEYDQESSRNSAIMKNLARLLVVVALICLSEAIWRSKRAQSRPAYNPHRHLP
jgi:hypothetical protein